MARYRDLIDRLYVDGRFQQDVYDELLHAESRVVRVLMRQLIVHPDSDIRETCAELLRDWGQARAVPALIEALRDKCLYVRQDALWAIGELCGLDIEDFLDIRSSDRGPKLYRRVSEWWNVNRRFVENNFMLW